MKFLNQKRKPHLSDIELIAIDLTSEYMSILQIKQEFKALVRWPYVVDVPYYMIFIGKVDNCFISAE